ncbi:MAG: Ig-like domain-containing protein [Brevinematia bacterium]
MQIKLCSYSSSVKVVYLFYLNDPTDSTRPTVAIVRPANGEIIYSTNITISGTASDDKSGVKGVYVSINGGSFVLASGTTSWSYNVNLSYGLHTARVYAIDNSNNISVTNQITFSNQPFTTNNVTVYYYRPDWSNVNIHYNNGSGWTSTPGVAMSRYNSNWWVRTVQVVSNAWKFCFNNI